MCIRDRREALGLEADKRASQAVLFHAPAVAFITIPKVHSEWMVLDAGALEAFLLLAAASRGVGSIPAFNLVRYQMCIRDRKYFASLSARSVGCFAIW